MREAGIDEIDHVAVAVRDTAEGAARIADITGAEPFIVDPEPGQWYHSGALPLDGGRFLEILGPNPAHRGFHPLKLAMRAWSEPRLLFWYVAVADFASFEDRARRAGVALSQVQSVDATGAGGSAYRRGIVGAHFRSQWPCVIEWRTRPERPQPTVGCRLERLELTHPSPEALNQPLAALGFATRIAPGPDAIALELSTPRGEVRFASPAFRASPVRMGSALLRGWLAGNR